VRTDVRQGGAISGRPRRVHARGAVPTWMSQRSLQRVIVSSGARISNDRLLKRQTAHRHRLCANCTSRIARHHNPSAARGRGSSEAARGNTWRGAREQKPWAQKLTRPDGEIRAGRVDRRRGSGGRERRSGL
jgi:hypothetical protein